MLQKLFAVLLMLFSQALSAESLKWQAKLSDDGAAVIFASTDGFVTLRAAIDSVPKDTWIKHIRVSALSEYSAFQSELHTYMRQHYPEELTQALASTGNMHNPKVVALRKAFSEAVLNSEFVKSVNADFSRRCERVTSVSFEKFMIYKKASTPLFEAMLWLTTENCL